MVWSKQKTILLVSGLVIVILIIFLFLNFFRPLEKNKTLARAIVEIGSASIVAEIASQPAEYYLGLSGRTDLCPDCGLLFKFPDSQQRSFVMRDMNFPLDIVFINQGQIIHMIEAALPGNNGEEVVYFSQQPSDLVLEIKAGYSRSHNWQTGDEVNIIYEN